MLNYYNDGQINRRFHWSRSDLMGNSSHTMSLRLKLFRHFKTALSLAVIALLAFLCAWLMVTLRSTSRDAIHEEDIETALASQREKLQTTANAQKNRNGLKFYSENANHPKHGQVAEATRKPKHGGSRKSSQDPSFLKILKIAADDFNLTCSHVLPQQKPRQLIKESKNPCFWDNHAQKLRCLPYFYIPGFPKCGTTDVYNVMKYHPEFVETEKEHHWFNHLQFMEEYDDVEVYLRKFVSVESKIARDIKDKGVSYRITGDFTPDYLCDNMRWRCMEGNQGLETPRYTNAHSIYALTPDAKFIIVMREPVERLYSRFKHMIHVSPSIFGKYWGDPTPETFHRAALRAITIYRECMAKHSARHCLYNETLYEHAMMNDIGLYSVCLEDYLQVFPRQNFLFLQFEQYTQSRAKVFEKVLKFLDMAPFPDNFQDKLNSTKVHNVGHFAKTPMLDETRAALRQFFAPFVEDLKKIVGEKLIESWGY